MHSSVWNVMTLETCVCCVAELALLTKKPRAATAVSVGRTKCAGQ